MQCFAPFTTTKLSAEFPIFNDFWQGQPKLMWDTCSLIEKRYKCFFTAPRDVLVDVVVMFFLEASQGCYRVQNIILTKVALEMRYKFINISSYVRHQEVTPVACFLDPKDKGMSDKNDNFFKKKCIMDTF